MSRVGLAVSRVEEMVRAALVDRVPRDHLQTDAAFMRRRLVVAVTLVGGATLLGFSLAVPPGDPAFYPLTGGLAAVWAVGAVASGPLHLGRIAFRGTLRLPILTPLLLGLLAAAGFLAGALLVRQIPPLRMLTNSVLDHARIGSLALVVAITLANGLAEELFFRGALYAAIGLRYPVVVSTILYGLATVATGNAMLVFAATLLGVVLGLQRRASGGVLGPMITHGTWSTVMLFVLPVVVGR